MSRRKEDYKGAGGNYPVHDYYRTSRDAFGTSYHAPLEVKQGNGSAAILIICAIAALAFLYFRIHS